MAEHLFYTQGVGGSIPSFRTIYARLAQSVEALVLGTKGSPFESEVGHQSFMAPSSIG